MIIHDEGKYGDGDGDDEDGDDEVPTFYAWKQGKYLSNRIVVNFGQNNIWRNPSKPLTHSKFKVE